MSDVFIGVIMACAWLCVCHAAVSFIKWLRGIRAIGRFTIIHWPGQSAWLSGSWLASGDR